MSDTLGVSLQDRQGRAVFYLLGREHAVEIGKPGQPGVCHAATVAEIARAVDTEEDVAALGPAVDVCPHPAATRGHALLLVYLASRWPQIHCHTAGPLHVTLAYALPLALDSAWRSWTEGHLELLVAGRQIVPVPAYELVAVNPVQADPRQHRRLLRSHSSTTVREHRDVDGFLDDWSRFSVWRHHRPVPAGERRALRAMLTLGGMAVRDFVHETGTVARALVCEHEQCRVLFDLMATWPPEHAKLRPGIYSGLWNLLDARRRGLRFSFCYGQFPYKDEIVGPAARLTLTELTGQNTSNSSRSATARES